MPTQTVDDARRDLARFADDAQGLLARLSPVLDEHDALRAGLDAARDDVALLRRALEAARDDGATLERALEASRQDGAQLRERLMSLEADNAAFRARLSALHARHTDMARLVAQGLQTMLAQVLPQASDAAEAGPPAAPAGAWPPPLAVNPPANGHAAPEPRAATASDGPMKSEIARAAHIPMVPPVPVEPRVTAPAQPAPAANGGLDTTPAALDAAVASALAAVAVADREAPVALDQAEADEDEEGAPLAPGAPAPRGAEGARVLLVDDEPHFTDLIAEFLVDKGFSVRVAHSGERALDTIAAFGPRVVLLDLMMPGMGGMEALRRIKAAQPDTSVIMVTAIDDRDTARRALALGASDYVTKPLTLDFLESVLAVHVPGVLPVALTADSSPGPALEPPAAAQSFFARR